MKTTENVQWPFRVLYILYTCIVLSLLLMQCVSSILMLKQVELEQIYSTFFGYFILQQCIL